MKVITFLIVLFVSCLVTFITFSIIFKSNLVSFQTVEDPVSENDLVEDQNKVSTTASSNEKIINNNSPESIDVSTSNEANSNNQSEANIKDNELVLNTSPTQKILPTITIKPSSTPTLISTIKPTPTPKLNIPDFTSEQINNFINNYSGKFGVDPNVIRHVALCESGFNPKASNWIYAGLFQFSPTTWVSWRNKMNQDSNTDLRYHAEEAVETATYAISLNKGSMWPNCMP